MEEDITVVKEKTIDPKNDEKEEKGTKIKIDQVLKIKKWISFIICLM